MATLRAFRVPSLCASCPRRFSTTRILRFDDIRSPSRLPRIASGSFWASLVPKPLRRTTDATVAPKAKKPWNPYTPFMFLALLIGSNAIQLLALRNEMLAFSRKTEAKLSLLREVIGKVKRGEINDEEVKRALGTGDRETEQEWEDVVREVEETDQLAEGERRREEKRRVKAEDRKRREDEEKANASPVAAERGPGRPKFLM
ncbi:hypothetical protein LTR53_003970 [Teratosphaeriaceae sp. CCFEE 6253]|nr:hypothetical protein LTR53_003970 [Teratosphaeriaceae sp. CCFEE 6253]